MMPDYGYTTDKSIPYPLKENLIAADAENLRLLMKAQAEKTDQQLTKATSDAVSALDPNIKALELALVSTQRNRGLLPNNTDWNSLTSPSDNGLWTLGSSSTYPNAAFTGSGQLQVSITGGGSGKQVALRAGFNQEYSRLLNNYYSTPRTWHPWDIQGKQAKDVPKGANLDDYRTPGQYRINSSADAQTLTGGWPDALGIPRTAAILDVQVSSTGFTFHTLHVYGTSGGFLERRSRNFTPPFPYTPWALLGSGSGSGGSVPQVGLANALRLDEFVQRRGGAKKTNGKAVVNLRFDHGLKNFDTIVRPLLEARNLKATLALNSRRWTEPENAPTTAAMVNGWVAAGKFDIANHGAHHNDATSFSGLEDVIVGGLTELRTQLPAAVIDGWIVPGVGGTGYGGFNTGSTPEKFYQTDAGRLILEHHAISSGAFPESLYRVLDGKPRQGLAHISIDERPVTEITAAIDTAIARKAGIQIMCHPMNLNGSGYTTTAQLIEILDYIVAQRDAGKLLIMGWYDMMLADAT